MNNKYQIGDVVKISKRLTDSGHWETISPVNAKILEIKPTVTFGPAYVIEINGERVRICYWESDIDRKISD